MIKHIMTLPNNNTDTVHSKMKKYTRNNEKIATDNSLKCNIIHMKYYKVVLNVFDC
jgi:hypothetical protein